MNVSGASAQASIDFAYMVSSSMPQASYYTQMVNSADLEEEDTSAEDTYEDEATAMVVAEATQEQADAANDSVGANVDVAA